MQKRQGISNTGTTPRINQGVTRSGIGDKKTGLQSSREVEVAEAEAPRLGLATMYPDFYVKQLRPLISMRDIKVLREVCRELFVKLTQYFPLTTVWFAQDDESLPKWRLKSNSLVDRKKFFEHLFPSLLEKDEKEVTEKEKVPQRIPCRFLCNLRPCFLLQFEKHPMLDKMDIQVLYIGTFFDPYKQFNQTTSLHSVKHLIIESINGSVGTMDSVDFRFLGKLESLELKKTGNVKVFFLPKSLRCLKLGEISESKPFELSNSAELTELKHVTIEDVRSCPSLDFLPTTIQSLHCDWVVGTLDLNRFEHLTHVTIEDSDLLISIDLRNCKNLISARVENRLGQEVLLPEHLKPTKNQISSSSSKPNLAAKSGGRQVSKQSKQPIKK